MTVREPTTHIRRPLRCLLPVLAAVALVAGACSDDGESGGSGSGEPGGSGSVEGAEITDFTPPEECDTEDPAALTAAAERGVPTVALPEGPTEGVVTTDVVEGDGDTVIPEGTVEVAYWVGTVDGTEIESTWADGVPRSEAIPVQGVFPAFAEGLEGMKVGGRRQIVIPGADAYGDQTPPGVQPGDPVVFVLDLVAVSEDAEGGASADEGALEAAEERGAPEMTVPDPLPSELTGYDEVEGDGVLVCPGMTVVAHYVGVDSSGEEFDSSWGRGEPASFSLDGVIEGWSEGLVGMKVGGRRTLVIPADLAYGEAPTGGQPAGDLVFTVDLVGAG